MGEGVEAFILSYSYKKKAKTHILSSRRKVGHVELQVLVAFSRGGRGCRWAALHIVKVRSAILGLGLCQTNKDVFWSELLFQDIGNIKEDFT